MDTFYDLVLIVDFLVIFGLFFAVNSVRHREKKSACSPGYDERQKLTQGQAYKAGFLTMVIFLATFYVLTYVFGLSFMESGNAIALGIFLGGTVFLVTSIRQDAYLRPNESMKSFLLVWLMVIVSNGLSVITQIHNGDLIVWQEGRLGGEWLNALILLMFLISLIVQAVRILKSRQEDMES